ncbi:MAG TPA: hypothetical protein VFB66_24360 [Tepidisphaeraceae bacterium]|nr:hypothetical protein [Tepidisphaeraceae bacterium]
MQITINIDKKALAVGVLSLGALGLIVANLMLAQTVQAEVAVKDRDYIAVTGKTPKGGDALYLTDNRTGVMAVFQFNPNQRSLQAIAVRPVSDAFGGGAARPVGGGRNDRNDRNDRPNR